jgi:hypothetical protein
MDDLLREQQEHYRKLAPWYDDDSDDPALADDRMLAGLPIRGDVLELVHRVGARFYVGSARGVYRDTRGLPEPGAGRSEVVSLRAGGARPS